jgi:hypothetical protein
VRIVTGLTVTLENNLVRAPCLFRKHLLVTAGAKFGIFRGQQTLVGRGMGLVAAGAFPSFKEGMDMTFFESFL